MQNSVRIATKIIFLLAVIFCGLSQILPLTVISAESGNEKEDGLDFYSWGMHQYASGEEWLIYFNPATFSEATDSDEQDDDVAESEVDPEIQTAVTIFLIFFILTLAVFPFCLISFFLGIYAFFKLDKTRSQASLAAGVLLVVCIVFFTIFQVSFSSLINTLIDSSSNSRLIVNWSIGYYFIIIAIILFFIGYYLQKSYLFVPAGFANQGYNPHLPVQPNQNQENYIPMQNRQPVPSPLPAEERSIYCPECGHKNPAGVKYCNECGEKIS